VDWALTRKLLNAMSERPKALFKYVHPDRIDILDKSLIRFTQPSLFNAPFEFCPAFSDWRFNFKQQF